MRSRYPRTFNSILFYGILLIILWINVLFMSRDFLWLFYSIIILMSYVVIGNIRWGRRMWYGLFVGAAMVTTIFIIELASGMVRVTGFPGMSFGILLLSVGLQVLVSLGEEMAFRGYILRNMLNEMKAPRAVLYSSVLFSVIHVPSMIFHQMGPLHSGIMATVVLLFSVLASLLYLRYGLLSAVGLHLGWNAFQYNVFSMQSRFEGLLEVDYASWGILFSGGELGPEAGILGMIVMTAGVLVLLNLK